MVLNIRIICPEAQSCASFASLGMYQRTEISVTSPLLLGPQRAAAVLR